MLPAFFAIRQRSCVIRVFPLCHCPFISSPTKKTSNTFRHKEVSLLLAAAHPSLSTDEGYVEKSFEGDEEHKPLEIAEEWGDEDVIAAIKAKL